jgi:hypothetical protein
LTVSETVDPWVPFAGIGALVEEGVVGQPFLEAGEAVRVDGEEVEEHAGVVEPEAVEVAAGHGISGVEVKSKDHPHRIQLFG